MLGMFNFLMDADNYAERKVGRDDFAWGFISTAQCSDGRQPYETAVLHRGYIREDGKEDSMCIVEGYDTRKQAEAGHAKWKKKMTAKRLPRSLVDCCNAEVAQVLDALSGGDSDGLRWNLR